MDKRRTRILAAVLTAALCSSAAAGGLMPGELPRAVYAAERQALIGGDIVNVRDGAGTANQVVAKLAYGTAVTVVDEENAPDGVTWYKIRFMYGSSQKEGYVSSQYVKSPSSYSTDANFEDYMNSQGFPESYKDSLRVMHTEHPGWVFNAQHTGVDWAEAVSNESKVGANLVSKDSKSSWKSTEYGAYDWGSGAWTGFDGSAWVAASEEIVSYYMDPRNFLNDTYVFQFLLQTYDSESQTRDGLESIISGTFLAGAASQSSNSENGPGGGESQGNGYVDDGSYGNGPGWAGPGQENTEPGGSGDGNSNPDVPGEEYGPGYSDSAQTETNVGPGYASSAETSPGSSLTPVIAAAALRAGMNYGPGMDTSQSEGQVNTSGPGGTSGQAGASGSGNTSGPGGSQDQGANGNGNVSAPQPQGQSYADVIMSAAAQSGVSPYVLASMILQEQGKGTSRSISGTAPGYEGYYNFFNVGAYATDSMDAVTRGLWYASQSGAYGRPWNSIEKSICGGAVYYGDNFVRQGQDTFYLKKFNVQGSNIYKHQYMTNIQAAAAEGAKMEDAYTDDMKGKALVFKIPVFNNMPEVVCAMPTTDGSPNNKLSALSVEGYPLTPTFNRDTESYDVIVNPATEQIRVTANAVDGKASVSGTGIVNLNDGVNTVSVEVTAENGHVRVYRLNIVRRSDAPDISVDAGSTGNGQNSQGAGPGAGGVGFWNIGPGMTDGPGYAQTSADQRQDGQSGEGQEAQSAGQAQSEQPSDTQPDQSSASEPAVVIGVPPS